MKKIFIVAPIVLALTACGSIKYGVEVCYQLSVN